MFKSIWIHANQNMNSCLIEKTGYGVIYTIPCDQFINKVDQYFPASHLHMTNENKNNFMSVYLPHIWK